MRVNTATIILSLTLGLAGLGVSQTRAQHNGLSLENELARLFELGKTAHTCKEMEKLFSRLCLEAPHDYRIPYGYAVILLKQRRYEEAAQQLDNALALNQADLNMWQSAIWLSVRAGEHEDALDKLVWLCKRVPADRHIGPVDMRCRKFADFAGAIVGYLEGPASDRVDQQFCAVDAYRIADGLTDSHRAIFERARQRVLSEQDALNREIDRLRAETRSAMEELQTRQLSHLERDEEYAWNELDKMEDLRAQVRQEGSEERSGAAQAQGQALATLAQLYSQAGWTQSYPYGQGAMQQNTGAIGAALGAQIAGINGLYAEAIARERAEQRRLHYRERKMYHRHRRIARDEKRTVLRHNTGNSPQLMAVKAKSKALVTYVPLPVSLEGRTQRLLASFRSPAAPALSHVAFATP